MRRQVTSDVQAGRKKTNRRRKIFLFIVIQFLTPSAVMLETEGRLRVYFFLGHFFIN